MDLIKSLPSQLKITKNGTIKRNQMGLFKCPVCQCEVERIKTVGKKSQTCGSTGCKPSGPKDGHGDSNSLFHRAWSNMLKYCRRSQHQFDESWVDYLVFKQDMFTTYFDGAKLSRKIAQQPYSKDNCFWTDSKNMLGLPSNSIQVSVVTGRQFEQHNMHNTRPYRIWQNMRLRCNNPKHNRYSTYGGKGIKVCQEWENSFTKFWLDMAIDYTEEMTIDRIDSNKGYTRENCRWVTLKENSSRSRATVTKQIDVNSGEVIKEWPSAREASLALGIDASSITKVVLGKKKSAGGFRWAI